MKTTEVCSACHEKADRAGKDAATLAAQIKGVVSGETKHKKTITLTDAEIADIAAYWSSNYLPDLDGLLENLDLTEFLAVGVDDVDGAREARIEAVDRAQYLQRLFWIVHRRTGERSLVGPGCPLASRGPEFQVLGTTA